MINGIRQLGWLGGAVALLGCVAIIFIIYIQIDLDYENVSSSSRSVGEASFDQASLETQKGILEATESMVAIGWFQSIVGFMGLLLIGATLHATFRTLDLSRITLEKAHEATRQAEKATEQAKLQTEILRDGARPFLMFEDIELLGDPKLAIGGGIEYLSSIEFNYTLRNYGQSPAHDVQFVGTGNTIDPYSIGEVQFSQYEWLVNIGGHAQRLNSIAPSASRKEPACLVNFDNGFQAGRNHKGNFHRGAERPHQRAICFIRLRYKDLSGRRFKEDFCFEVTGSDYGERTYGINLMIRPKIKVLEPQAAVQGYPDYIHS